MDLSNFTDSDLGLGSALTLSRFRIWTWIQFLLQFGSDSESIKFNGFGLGFNLFYGLGWIQNPLSITDSDLDSTCSRDQNLGELCFRPQIGLDYGLFLAFIWIQNRIWV